MGLHMSKASCFVCTIAKSGMCKYGEDTYGFHFHPGVQILQVCINVQVKQRFEAFKMGSRCYTLAHPIFSRIG
jgi:hypothetical protein